MIVKLSDLMKNQKENRNFYLFYGANIGQIEEVINNLLKPKFSKTFIINMKMK